MKIFHNVISDDLRQKCLDYISLERTYGVWKVSNHHWNSSVRVAVVGDCCYTDIPTELFFEIIDSASNVFPNIKNIKYEPDTCNFYCWGKFSGISWHNDGHRKYGITIYLNEIWDENHGGIFLWKNKTGEIKGVMPTKNMMVVNDEHEFHMVTPISPYANEDRMTIQMFLNEHPCE
jgi:hypothetical protein